MPKQSRSSPATVFHPFFFSWSKDSLFQAARRHHTHIHTDIHATGARSKASRIHIPPRPPAACKIDPSPHCRPLWLLKTLAQAGRGSEHHFWASRSRCLAVQNTLLFQPTNGVVARTWLCLYCLVCWARRGLKAVHSPPQYGLIHSSSCYPVFVHAIL
jgi:hypothetical protein